jgi:tight adherence protein B
MNPIFIALVIFIAAIFTIEMGMYAYRTIRNPNRNKIRRRLRSLSSSEYSAGTTDLLKKKRPLSAVPFLNALLFHIPGIHRLDRVILQADLKSSLGFFVLLSMCLAMAGYLATVILTRNSLFSVLAAIVLGLLPLLYVHFKKRQRMQKFERQLPESLDLIARALKAGNAFTTGMKLAADEFEDPLGTEFHETLDEINFGVSVPDALRHLALRVDCQDLRYFIVSVILQRETGGNLAEVIESIAYIIRERFKLRGKIRILSAEGRLSAIILSIIPFGIILAIHFISPGYHDPLFSVPMGKILAGLSAFLMFLGLWSIKRMINIKV